MLYVWRRSTCETADKLPQNSSIGDNWCLPGEPSKDLAVTEGYIVKPHLKTKKKNERKLSEHKQKFEKDETKNKTEK